MDRDLAQLKLSNGSEIVCEVMEWPDVDSNQLIIRNALQIVAYEYHDDVDRSYAFRPFINFLENEQNYVMVNTDHVISMNRPTDYLIDQYYIGIREVENNIKTRLQNFRKERLEGLQKLADSVEKLLLNKTQKPEPSKKEPSNIIIFPFKDDTVH